MVIQSVGSSPLGVCLESPLHVVGKLSPEFAEVWARGKSALYSATPSFIKDTADPPYNDKQLYSASPICLTDKNYIHASRINVAGYYVFGQEFSPDGKLIGSAFQITPAGASIGDSGIAVALGDNADGYPVFAYVWAESYPGSSTTDQWICEIFSTDGINTPTKLQTRKSIYSPFPLTGRSAGTDVCKTKLFGFLVAWSYYDVQVFPTDNYAVGLQRMDGSCNPVGSPVFVVARTPDYQEYPGYVYPKVSASLVFSDDALVIYQKYASSSYIAELWGARYTLAGTTPALEGSPFQITTQGKYWQASHFCACLENGLFVVAYEDATTRAPYFQLYDFTGSGTPVAVGSPVLIPGGNRLWGLAAIKNSCFVTVSGNTTINKYDGAGTWLATCASKYLVADGNAYGIAPTIH